MVSAAQGVRSVSMKIWLRPLPFALIGAYALARAGRAPIDDAAATRSAALCSALAPGIVCAPEDVAWVDAPAGAVTSALGGQARAVVRGRVGDESPDLFL